MAGKAETDRAYQVEMFEASVKENVIVCMGTGTGKTRVAKLRIEAELWRTPGKRVWFTAPNVVLAKQQHMALTSQLPAFQMRTLLGEDNVDFWKTQDVWDAALDGMHVIISTPQVLLDALRHAFVHLEDIALLVVDEAHHAQASDPSAKIMTQHYSRIHPPSVRPQVLGLTASARISYKTASISALESTLSAICRTPTRSIEEYSTHLQQALLVTVEYTPVPQRPTKLLMCLREVVAKLQLDDDPYFHFLQQTDDENLRQKLADIKKKGATPAMDEIRKLLGGAEDLHVNTGAWAADHFLETCVMNWHKMVLSNPNLCEMTPRKSSTFINDRLQQLRLLVPKREALMSELVSVKAQKLIDFLAAEYHEGIAIIIFVERRSTAFALCELLRRAPKLWNYRVFPFVGLAASRLGSLSEVADRQLSDAAFADFRSGAQDICVATSVLEEGIDVQAVNIVIRFDDPKQFVSYLQSRGRARKAGSKFVHFRNTLDSSAKYAQWKMFEAELEEEYKKDRAEKEHLEAADRATTLSHETYLVRSSGAVLSYDNAVQSLQNFCHIATRGSDPVYIMEGELGSIKARVILPSDVPVELQQVMSKYEWPGQKSARRDAAFQAFKALHKADLVSDNLLPFREEQAHGEQAKHLSRQYHIPSQFSPWIASGRQGSYNYMIDITCGEEQWPRTAISLPQPIRHVLNFKISESPTRMLDVKVVPTGECAWPTPTDLDITQSLFAHAFLGGSAWESLHDSSRIQFSMVPEQCDDSSYCVEPSRLVEFVKHHGVHLGCHPLLIWAGKSPRPHKWLPTSLELDAISSLDDVTVTKVKQLQIYSGIKGLPGNEVQLQQGITFAVDECLTKGHASLYGPSVLMLPTILHVLEAALRAQAAQQAVFKDIAFSTAEYLLPALLAKSALGTFNYERLEFFGDMLLKFRASLQLFADCPRHMADGLTKKVQELVSNERLSKSALTVGLCPYITTQASVQKHWKLPLQTVEDVEEIGRQVSSKTLADVVESSLAAAYFEGEKTGNADVLCTKALGLFLPEVNWQHPCDILSVQTSTPPSTRIGETLVEPIEQIFGYRFKNPERLLQAMTHSSATPGILSYDRFEFLGDAILDVLIKKRLFAYSNLSPERMTNFRHALASHEYLAFCALGLCGSRAVRHVSMTQGRKLNVSEIDDPMKFTDLLIFDTAHHREAIRLAHQNYSKQRPSIDQQLETGNFPWGRLRSLQAPKVCSDIVESLLAAIYLDSNGSFGECEKIIDTLGITKLLYRMAPDSEYEARTPAGILGELCEQHKLHVDIEKPETDASGLFVGHVSVNSQSGELNRYAGPASASLDEARTVAVEIALQEILAQLAASEDTVTSSKDGCCFSQGCLVTGTSASEDSIDEMDGGVRVL